MSDSREPFSAEKMFVSPELAALHRQGGERVLDWVKRVNTYIPITPEASVPLTTPPKLVRSERIWSKHDHDELESVKINLFGGSKRICSNPDRDSLEHRRVALIAASARIKDLKSKILTEAADIYRPKFKKHGCEDLFQELMDDIDYWLVNV